VTLIEWIAQILGLLAFTISLVGYTSTSDHRLKAMIAMGTAAFTLQFICLGAWLVSISLMMNTARSWLSIYRKGFSWFLLVISIQLMVSIPLARSYHDIFPIAGSILGSFGLLCLDGIRLRMAMFATTCFWFINNLLWGSIGGVMLDLLNASANLIAIYRIYCMQKQIDGKAKEQPLR